MPEENYRRRALEIHEKLMEAHEKGALKLKDHDAALVFSYLASLLIEAPSLKRKKVYPDLGVTHYHVLLAAAARALGIPLLRLRAGDLTLLLGGGGAYAFVSDIASRDGVRLAARRIQTREHALNEAIRRLLEELRGQHSRSSSS